MDELSTEPQAVDSASQDAAHEQEDQLPVPRESSEKKVPYQALKEERRKRQEAAAKLEEAQKLIADYQARQANGQQQQPYVDEFEIKDDEYYDIPVVTKKLRGQMERAMLNERLNTSLAVGEAMFPDFKEVVDQYQEVLRESPGIDTHVRSSALPAVAAYKAIKNHLKAKNAMDPEQIEKMVEEKAAAKVAELLREAGIGGGAGQAQAKPALNLPPSLAGVRGVGGNKSVPRPPPGDPIKALPFTKLMGSKR